MTEWVEATVEIRLTDNAQRTYARAFRCTATVREGWRGLVDTALLHFDETGRLFEKDNILEEDK